jgi:DNA topoisomerase-1
MVVNDLLVARFSDLMDYNFTAKMEDNLDKIEEGVFKWVDIVNDFYQPFDKLLGEAMENMERVKPEDIPTDQVCEKCGKPMVIKWGRHGRFIACTGYPECKNTMPLEGEGEGGAQGVEAQKIDEKCDKCGSDMVIKTGKFGKFLACSRYPECKNTKPLAIGVKCPEDGGDIVEKRSRKGKVFYGCGNYPKCKFATWYRPVRKKCPECGGILAEKRTKKEEALVCLDKSCKYKEELSTEDRE